MAKQRSEDAGKPGRKVRVDLRRNRGKTTRQKNLPTKRYRDGDAEQEGEASVENVRVKGELSRKRTVSQPSENELAELRGGVVVALRGLIAEVDDGQRIRACTIRRMLRTRRIKERHPIAVGDAVRFLPVERSGSAPADAAPASSDPASRAPASPTPPSSGPALPAPDSRAPALSAPASPVPASSAPASPTPDSRAPASLESPDGVIESVEPRRTTLLRLYERRVQVVAANVDLAVIVVAADQPTLRPHLIDRFLVSALYGHLEPVVCINKMDLDVDGVAAGVAQRYAAIGYPSLTTSIVTNQGLDALREVLRARTSVLAGPSGVGKSSLLNALDPGLQLKVGTLTDLQRGRHTTTTARLLRWAFGGYVVDTPGLRQFELIKMQPGELEGYFVEFVDLVALCRFPDCSHTHEEGCAVQAAVEEERIDAARYESYCRMYEECASKRKYR